MIPGAPAISIQAVSKRFGRRLAVDKVSLEIPRGSVFGLLGHNGAGKSTLIGMILGQIFPDSGTVKIAGHDVESKRAAALARVGAIYEQPAFYDYLSGERNLRIYCEYSGRTNPAELQRVVEMVGLTPRIGDKVRTYSHGMRQRLALAQALLPGPETLILDEPTEGLDPEGIYENRNLLLKLHRDFGITVIVSSHQLSEMEQICTHVGIMHAGRLGYAGEWKPGGEQDQLLLRVDRQAKAEEHLKASGLIAEAADLRLTPGTSVSMIAAALLEEGFVIEQISRRACRLEDFYLQTVHRNPEL